MGRRISKLCDRKGGRATAVALLLLSALVAVAGGEEAASCAELQCSRIGGDDVPCCGTGGTAPAADLVGVVISTLFVSKDGTTPFDSIQKAVDTIPPANKQWVRIHVSPGVYREKVTISKPFVLLEGEGQAQTSIEWGDFAPGGQGTDKTATFFVNTTDFMARRMTFKNTYDGGNETAPAVALQVNGDRAAFYECGFVSVQDTISDLSGRHYYKNCVVQGAIDFIFGYGFTVFEGCELRTVKLPTGRSPGFITAQGRNIHNSSSAFVFKSCSVGGITPVYLGRGWRTYAQVVFYRTSMSDVVIPRGWEAWNGDRNRMNLVESDCTGPGSDRSARVPWSKGLSGTDPAVLKFVDPAYVDSDLWIEAQPH